MITNDFSNGSIDYLSSLIDFSHLDTLSLTLDLSEQSFKNIGIIINTLLDRTYNVQSIHLYSTRSKNFIEYLQIISPMISNQVKQLTVTVDIENAREIQWILDRFEKFSSITFRSKNSSLQFDQIIEELNRRGRDFTYDNKCGTWSSFWFGKQKLNN